MDSTRQEYPALVDILEPMVAVQALNDRVIHVTKLNNEIADWLSERRRIEEQYVTGLRKLALKEPPSDSSELGVFTTPWQKIAKSAERIAESHQALASQMAVNVEQPLRNFATTNREMQSMSTMQGNLLSLAKDCESAQKKVDKKGDAGRGELENAMSQWKSQAPYVFEALQALDEARCNHLRDLLTQFQTSEVEVVSKNQRNAENVINSILEIETANEIRTFITRTKDTAGRAAPLPPAARRASRTATANSVGTQSTNSAAPLPPPPRDDASQSSAVPVEKKSRLSGLKRLGTVVSRRKSTQPHQLGKIPSEQDLATSGIGSGSRSTGSRLRPAREESTESAAPTSPPRSPPPRLDPIPNINGERPAATRELSDSSLGNVAPPPGPPPSQRPQATGVSNDLAGIDLSSPAPGSQNGISVNPPPPAKELDQVPAPVNGTPRETTSRDGEGFSVPPPATDPISLAQAQNESESSSAQPKVLLRDAPIPEDKAESEAAMASMANKLREQATQPRRSTTNRGRRDVRSAIFAPSQVPLTPPVDDSTRSRSQQRQTTGTPTLASPIDESQVSALSFSTPTDPKPSIEQGLFTPTSVPQTRDIPVANSGVPRSAGSTLLSTPFLSSIRPDPPVVTQPVAQQTTITSPTNDFSSSVASSTPFNPSASMASRPSIAEDPSAQSDTQSVRSSRSAGTSAAGGANRHPDLTTPGLSSSIMETVSVWFEEGSLARATLIGELALAYNSDPHTPGSYIPETIRLDNFSVLDKIAPNLSFVTPTTTAGTDKAGEYSIDVTAIPRTTVAFKYQVHLDSSNLAAQGPLLLSPTWRIEATQASVILSYGPSPTLSQPLTLRNVVIAITVEGVPAKSCMSKPTGTFSKERSMIFWRFDEIVLTPGGASSQKLLARFTTDGEAKPGRAEARWEVNGPTGALGSGLSVSKLESSADDPFADSDESTTTWKVVDAVRKINSGTYVAN